MSTKYLAQTVENINRPAGIEDETSEQQIWINDVILRGSSASNSQVYMGMLAYCYTMQYKARHVLFMKYRSKSSTNTSTNW